MNKAFVKVCRITPSNMNELVTDWVGNGAGGCGFIQGYYELMFQKYKRKGGWEE